MHRKECCRFPTFGCEPRQGTASQMREHTRLSAAPRSSFCRCINENGDDKSHLRFRGAATQSISEFFAASISEKLTVLLPSLKLNVIVSLSSNR